MRHNVYGKKLGRNKDERDRLFKGLISEIFLRGSIQTSEAKAKAIKGLIDKIITLAKNKTSKRLIQGYFNNKLLQERFVKEILPKLENRTSGYTSLVKLGKRAGDNTMMVKMSLIGVGELKPIKKEKVTSDKTQVKSEKTKKVVSEKKINSKKSSEKKVSTGQSVRKTQVRRKRTSRLSKTK